MVGLPVTIYEQNNQKGIAVVFTALLLVIPILIGGLQLNHVSYGTMGANLNGSHYFPFFIWTVYYYY